MAQQVALLHCLQDPLQILVQTLANLTKQLHGYSQLVQVSAGVVP